MGHRGAAARSTHFRCHWCTRPSNTCAALAALRCARVDIYGVWYVAAASSLYRMLRGDEVAAFDADLEGETASTRKARDGAVRR